MERVPGLRDYHKQLIALRESHPSLHSRKWTRLELEAARDQVAYAYLRYHDKYADPILVLLNFSEETAELKFTLPEEFTSLTKAGSTQDLLSGERVALGNGDLQTVSVPGFGVRLLSAKGIAL